MIQYRILIAASAFALAFAAGFALKSRLAAADIERLKADIVGIEARHEKERRAAAEEAANRMNRAQAAAQAAQARAAQMQTRLEQEKNRAKAALYGLHNRPCLDGAAVSLLTQSPGISLALPAGAVEPDRAHAGTSAAADLTQSGPGSRDIAIWISDAAALYESCRARIDAIRAWDEEVNDGR